ncbi:MAG: hypothetical protein ACLUHA_06965 [Bacteroides stercoris]
MKKAISNAKFRASYGSLGNNSGVGRYEQKKQWELSERQLYNSWSTPVLQPTNSANKMI